jgi:hypothetical protein
VQSLLRKEFQEYGHDIYQWIDPSSAIARRMAREAAVDAASDSIVSEDKAAHGPYLPYLDCVVKEVARVQPLLTLVFPELTAKEVRLRDYVIPANVRSRISNHTPIPYTNLLRFNTDAGVYRPNVSAFQSAVLARS